MKRASLLHPMAVFAVLCVAAACGGGSSGGSATPTPTATMATASTEGLLSDEHPECPHSYGQILAPKRRWQMGILVAAPEVMTFPNGFTVSSVHTNIPEYNDCQPVLDKTGRYGPLFAVFAAYHLDSMQLAKSPAADTMRVSAAAEVLDWSVDYWYQPLGIGPYFNCLYVYGRADAPEAAMVHVGPQERNCGGSITTDSLNRLNPTRLAVIASRIPSAASSDYPAVARWDWDDVNKIQYVGLRCGDAWCEVGPKATGGAASVAAGPGFKPSAPNMPSGRAMTAEYRVRAIKGWYDQQDLSTVRGNSPVHTNIRGFLFPDPNLGTYTQASFEAGWQPMSHVAIRPSGTAGEADVLLDYLKKFNFKVVSPGAQLSEMNTIWMRHAKLGEDGVPSSATPTMIASCSPDTIAALKAGGRTYLAKLTQAGGGGTPIFRCMTWRSEGPESPEKTVRWRFITNDETVWQECLAGCCQVEAALQ